MKPGKPSSSFKEKEYDRGGRGGRPGRDRDSHDRGDDRDGGSIRDGVKRRYRYPADMVFDYKDTDTLKRFLTEEGRVVPARVSRLSMRQQRKLTREVKRARQLALLPFCGQHRMS